jgi:hypothetical protein
VAELHRAGFTESQIGVASHDRAGTVEKGSHISEGVAIGAASGAGLGALWAIGMAAGLLPAVGPVVAGGLLGSILASAAGAAAVGGIVGALIGLGLPEEEAKYYETEFKAGRTLVTVKADGRADEAWAILIRHGAYNWHTTSATRTDDSGARAVRVPVAREQVIAEEMVVERPNRPAERR